MSAPRDDWRNFTLSALSIYWKTGSQGILDLPFPTLDLPSQTTLPPVVVRIQVPPELSSCAVGGYLLIPECALADQSHPHFTKVDWILAAFWFISGLAEQKHECIDGTIHSYSFKLRGWDSEIWQHAWANRIAIFLRMYSSQLRNQPEVEIFGPRPNAEFFLTFDLDAIEKTFRIRVKQFTFQIFKSLRATIRMRFTEALHNLQRGFQFFLCQGDYQQISNIVDALKESAAKKIVFIYAGKKTNPFSISQQLMDPAYPFDTEYVRQSISLLTSNGFEIGLHPAFGSWNQPLSLREERERLEDLAKQPVRICRQHWLRFSWEHSWKCQESASLTVDSTLGFNDRPGFRTSCALRYHPWSLNDNRQHSILALPLVLMDSQLYDYSEGIPSERLKTMEHLVNEVTFTGGSCAFLWHPHTLSSDFGWLEGFKKLISLFDTTRLRPTNAPTP